MGSAFGAGAGDTTGAALPQQLPQDEQLSQQSLWRNRFSKRFRQPSSQPQSPQVEPQLEPQLVPQVSQLLWWNRPNSRFRPDSPHESQQLAADTEAQLGAGAQQLPQVSQPQLECLKRLNNLFRQPSSQQVSQHDEPQPPPLQLDATAGAAAGGAAFAAGAAESAPASQAVVISTNAAFTKYPPIESVYGARRAYLARHTAVGRPRTSTFKNSADASWQRDTRPPSDPRIAGFWVNDSATCLPFLKQLSECSCKPVIRPFPPVSFVQLPASATNGLRGRSSRTLHIFAFAQRKTLSQCMAWGLE
jgi:hypothetical protein